LTSSARSRTEPGCQLSVLRLVAFVWRHPLNADARLRAIGRVLRWQIASRLFAGPIALPFVEDTRLFASRGMTGATGNWYCGLHESAGMGFILHFLRSDDLFLDVGANIGSYSVMVAGGVGAKVISIEPIPETFANLQTNVTLNALADRVELHCLGLSNRRSELRFIADQDTINHVMAEGEPGNGIPVPVVAMDELLAGRVPAVIKIDVEGHEHAVVEGAHRTFSDPALAAVVMEINGSGARYGVDDGELLTKMHAYGFKPYSYDPISRQLRDWIASSGDAIFIRDADAAGARVMRAQRYRLVNGTI